MAKLTLSDVSNLSNEASAISTMQSNNTAIEDAMEITLSRDGTSPNSMLADFDMNSNRILNLPEPVNDTEPVRLGDIKSGQDGLTIASQAEAEAGTSNATLMTPLRTDQYLDAQRSALSVVNDTNVTLTLSESPTTALVDSATITAGWTGTLANARLADMAQSTIKGRSSGAGTGVPQDLTVAQTQVVLGLASSSTDNAIVRFNGTTGGTQNSSILIDDSNIVTGGTWNGALGATPFANPSVSIGLSATNGAATTAMRSDAAPALSQAIAPNWSAAHVWGNGSTYGVAISAANGAAVQTRGADLNLGAAHTAGYSWIQSYNSLPLALNPEGNNVLIGTNTNSTFTLDVAGDARITTSALLTGLTTAQTGTGTSETLSFNLIDITSDDVVAGTATPSTGFVNGLRVNHSFGGAATKGGRNAIFGNLTLAAATHAANPYNFNAALLGWATAAAGITDTAANLYGAGATAHVLAGASIAGAIAAEFTAGIEATGSATTRASLILNGLGGASVQGSTTDVLLWLTNQASAAKFTYGILFSSGGGDDPIDSTNGVLISAQGNKTVLHGVDFTGYNFTGGSFKSNGFSVDGSGNILGLSIGLNGATSGSLKLQSPAVAGANTLTLPAGTTDFSATGGASQVVKQTSTGGAFTVGQLAAADLSNGTTGTGSVVLAASPTFTGTIQAAKATFATGAQQNFLVGQWGGDSTYGGLSMNGTLVAGSMAGFFGGNSGDNVLYVVGPGNIVLRPTGASSNTFTFNTTQFTSTVGISAGSSIYALNGTAIPAGGTAGAGFKFSSTANFGVFFGSGAPTLAAAKGSLYLRSDGTGTGDRAYINTDGNTTWTALTTAA